MVQLLVHASADVDAADNRKITPLMAAFRKVQNKILIVGCVRLHSVKAFWLLTTLLHVLGSCEGGAVSCEGGQPVPIRYRVHEIYRHHR